MEPTVFVFMGWACPVNKTGKEQGRTLLAPTAWQPAGAGSRAIQRDPTVLEWHRAHLG